MDPNLKKRKKEEQQFLESRMFNLVDEEIKISKLNKIKLLNDWRIVMRIAKVDEIRKELTLYLKNFNREIDNKDAILQMLDADIDEAEEQYQIALNNHFVHLQQLTNLQDSRIKGLFKEFDKDVSELEMEFKNEFDQIKDNFFDEQSEILKMLKFLNSEIELKSNKQKEDFRSMRETLLSDIKEKYTKIQERIQKMADNEVNIFNSELNDIKAKAEEKNKLDKSYITTLTNLDRSISNLKAKVEKLTDEHKQLKIKIKQNQEDWEQKNKSIKEEKEKINKSYKILKAKMNQFRNGQLEMLTNLVKNSFNCNIKLESYIKISEKILKLAEICRRLETEKEKIVPYYSTIDNLDDNNINNTNNINMPDAYKIFGIDPDLYDEIESLQNFWKRYNKVQLDVITISKQKEEISKQNQLLKNLLQQYYDGLTVNNYVMNSKENPLLVIDNKDKIRNPIEEKETNYTIQEANFIYDDVMKQHYFSKIK